MKNNNTNLYKVQILAENDLFLLNEWIRGKNKIEAIENAMNLIKGWRNKDSIVSIEIVAQDVQNKELSAIDYN